MNRRASASCSACCWPALCKLAELLTQEICKPRSAISFLDCSRRVAPNSVRGRGLKILLHYPGKIRNRYIRLFELGMPGFFPSVRMCHQHERARKTISQFLNLERNTRLTVRPPRPGKQGTTALQHLAALFSSRPNSVARIPPVCPRRASGSRDLRRNDSRRASVP